MKSIEEIIKEKMAKNKARKWGKADENGVVEHIEAEAEKEVTDADIEREALILAKKHAKQSVGDFAVGFNWGAKYVKNKIL